MRHDGQVAVRMVGSSPRTHRRQLWPLDPRSCLALAGPPSWPGLPPAGPLAASGTRRLRPCPRGKGSAMRNGYRWREVDAWSCARQRWVEVRLARRPRPRIPPRPGTSTTPRTPTCESTADSLALLGPSCALCLLRLLLGPGGGREGVRAGDAGLSGLEEECLGRVGGGSTRDAGRGRGAGEDRGSVRGRGLC